MACASDSVGHCAGHFIVSHNIYLLKRDFCEAEFTNIRWTCFYSY